MKNYILLALSFFTFASHAVATEDFGTPAGKWKTIDDETKQLKSIVEIAEKDGKLTGKILQLFRNPTEEQNPLCDKCSGERKDKPIIGMTILWDLRKDGQKWSDGSILDPKNGKTYHCQLRLKDNGKKLDVRGYIGGITLLGRSQTWDRN